MKDVLNCTPALWLQQEKNMFHIIFNNPLRHLIVLQISKEFVHLSCSIIFQ